MGRKIIGTKYNLTYSKAVGDWTLKADGAQRATKRFPTKEAATHAGALDSVVAQGGSSVTIYNEDGTIDEERTFNPPPPTQ